MLNIENSHRPLREIVYDELKMQILTGQIEPGTRMMEVEMAKEMGVSRTPVREAIRKLEKEGLVTIEPRRGAYASEVSVRDMIEILEVREEIEGLATELAAKRMDDDTKARLYRTADKYGEAVKDNDTGEMIKLDTEFHHIIVEGSSNKILMNVVEQLQELVLRFRYIYYDDFRRAEKMPREHKAIIEGIKSGNAKSARKAAEDHVEQLKSVVENDYAFAESDRR
jgi:DNA-binding GntR family transcriptional regulator